MLRFAKILALLLLLSGSSVYAETISGKVTDEKGAALAGVRVEIPALNKALLSNEEGQYTFTDLSRGVYTLEFKRTGYSGSSEKVELLSSQAEVSTVLRASLIAMPAITITAKPQPAEILTSPQSVAVIEGRKMNEERGENVMESIANTPGAATYTTGAGIAKPVIRGLTSQRVLNVVDGVRQEGQQWGDEHGPEIDSLSVKRIEVLRGPNSLLYGSDALGGVISITQADLPSSFGGDPKLGGNLTYNGFTNNKQNSGAVSLYGALGAFGYRGQFSRREAGNISTPKGDLANSGVSEVNGNGTVGIKQDWGSFDVDIAHFDQKLEIPEDPAESPTATPFQKIHHDKVTAHLNVPTDLVRLEIAGGYQVNGRKEFEEKTAQAPGLNLWLRTATLDIKGHHRPIGLLSGTVGFSLMRQTNQTLGEETLIPSFNTSNFGAFIYEELPIEKFTFNAGVRGDWRNLNVDENEGLGVAAQTRDYSSASGALGAVWHVFEPLAFAVNLGRGWRAPTAFELFSNGVHEGTGRFEIGDVNLKPEESFNLDTSIRYSSNKIKGEVTFFRNQIHNYVYAEKKLVNGEEVTDTDSGLPVYLTKQANAVLLGSEFTLEAQLIDWLILNSGYDILNGTNEQLHAPLPRIPANRARVGVRLETQTLGFLLNPYIAAKVKMTDTQNRLAEGETRTGGYTLVDLDWGTELLLWGNRVSLDFGIDNLFDRPYADHLSRLKSFALAPGRNFFVKITVPFELVKN